LTEQFWPSNVESVLLKTSEVAVTLSTLPTSHGDARPRPADEAPHHLRVVPSTAVDLDAAEAAARSFLAALGVDLTDESRAESPARMARAYAEMLTPRPFDLTTFPNDEGYDELVVARSLPVQSVCEHHLLPFTGIAHVGYLPGERILGLSKLARVVELFARRPQVQERLTQQVARWLWETLEPRGVGVVVEADHQCMSLRGVRAPDATTVTSALLGTLRDDARSRAEFLALAAPTGGAR
jgi:GTP cyclohydrolase IA